MKIVILILSVLIGSLLTQFLSKNTKTLKLLLSFSGALLLSMMFHHLIPELYSHHLSSENISYWIIGGFLLQLLLDYYSQGIEHGHIHIKKQGMPWLVAVSLLIHALIEGLPLGESHAHGGHDHHEVMQHGLALVWGIALHKLPISIALTTLLIKSSLKAGWRWLFIGVFALMTPLGIWLSDWQLGAWVDARYFTALLVGMLLHVSTTILFESSDKHKYAWGKLLVILMGLAVGFAL